MPSIFPRLRLYILPLRPYSTRDRTSDRIPTNDPSPAKPVQNVSDSNALPISPQGLRDSDRPLQEVPEDSERQRVMQAPNREGVWSRSQQPRERAMSGPRFEQTIMEYQVCSHMLRDSCWFKRPVLRDWLIVMGIPKPQPEAAINLIHKQPVRWIKTRTVSCDGGGGPLGHPKIFINVDKPQICWCTYCGLPFVRPPLSKSCNRRSRIQDPNLQAQAHEHHRNLLRSLPSTTYPLQPVGHPAEVPESQRVNDEPFGHR